jgi:ATP-dependent DNA helicase RecG
MSSIFQISEHFFEPRFPAERGTLEVTAEVTAQVGAFCREPRSAREIMEMLGLKHWKTFQNNYLNPLLEADFVERTIPDKPKSRMQKYRLTAAGRRLLATRQGGGHA